MNLAEIWRRITTTPYARALEAELTGERAKVAEQGIEIARLRAENRALLNSILGIAGVPPVAAPLTISPQRKVKTRRHLRRAHSKSFAPTRECNPARRRAHAPPFLAPNPPPPRIRIRAKRKARRGSATAGRPVA